MRICVLGNSHIATLKQAWDNTPHKAHSLTFFGAVRDMLLGLRVRKGLLIPDNDALADSLAFTSGGLRRVDPAQYDAFLVFGLCRKVHRQVENFAPGLSSAVLEQTLGDYWQARNLWRMAARLSRVTGQTIHLGHSPLETRETDMAIAQGHYPAFIAASNRLVFAPINAELLPQPPETVLGGLATPARFGIGSTRLADGRPRPNAQHAEGERCHMNADFGALWLSAFFDHLAQKKGRPTGTAL